MRLRLLAVLLAVLLVAGASAEGDLVRRLYQAEQDGRTAPQLALPASALPPAVQRRLSDVRLSWGSLSGLLQRALLWDSGFVFVTPTKLAQIYTSCARTMADLHVDLAAIQTLQTNGSSCDVQRCGLNNHFLSKSCPTDRVARVARCAVSPADLADASDATGVFWAEDGQNPDVPNAVLRRHAQRGLDGAAANLYAIHLSDRIFDGPRACQLRGDPIIPCRDRTDTDIDFCEAAFGATVDVWLRLVATPRDRPFSTKALTLIFTLSAVLVAVLAVLVHVQRQRSMAKTDDEPAPTDQFLSVDIHGNNSSMDVFEAHARAEGGSVEDQISNNALCAKSALLQRFVSDPSIITKRIAFSHLNFLRVLSKGANGEVWLGQLESRYVAIKCLLPTKRKDLRALEQFSEEIRLASLLEHPRIVSFCGIAWHSLMNLSIVTEYMEKGDLESFLALPTTPEQLSWAREKALLARDIADALVYLHSLVPVVIHRDLKSKNILLDQQLRAKLSDFGLSRETSTDETMTNGVGTILWSAPEVLEGKRYDEKSDIFSFGIVLSEIDTCALPYGFNKDKSRNKMKSMQIVHLVAEGKLLPTFRDDCPAEIVALARSCLDLDPSRRPSAMQIVHTLRSRVLPAVARQAPTSSGSQAQEEPTGLARTLSTRTSSSTSSWSSRPKRSQSRSHN
ncbi:hypothetical protein ATCC90586_004338 [Pythium insidiosum]|nr:hypothetical protein ATCC90586_004338 [Pythium insidiosum]